MKIGKSKTRKGGNYAPCENCREYYKQAVYMYIGRKWTKIGEGCPECLKKKLLE
ncbi:MAG: hypothetical protein QG646_1177 [Euryarchaeota archaeon]|jgi:hypothetical protein|nr:hypothetical protein [Euryarchaeota archaeon]